MQHSNDEHYPESSPKPSPRGLRHAKEAFLHAPPGRRVDMLPPTRDDAPCRIRYSDGSPTSIDVGSFERQTNSNVRPMPERGSVWDAHRAFGRRAVRRNSSYRSRDDLLVCLRLNGVFTAIYNNVDARVSGNAQGLFPEARERKLEKLAKSSRRVESTRRQKHFWAQ